MIDPEILKALGWTPASYARYEQLCEQIRRNVEETQGLLDAASRRKTSAHKRPGGDIDFQRVLADLGRECRGPK